MLYCFYKIILKIRANLKRHNRVYIQVSKVIRQLRCYWFYYGLRLAEKSNRPRLIYKDSNMALRLSGQTSIFGVVFFVSKSLLGIERQKKLNKLAILTRKPWSHIRILIYRTWPIGNKLVWF